MGFLFVVLLVVLIMILASCIYFLIFQYADFSIIQYDEPIFNRFFYFCKRNKIKVF